MIYFNGQIIAPESVRISPADRGFLLADGLFETMKADEGQISSLSEHWARLKKSADFLEIPLPLDCRELEKIVYELLTCNDLTRQNAGLRLTLTRGCGPRGLLPPARPDPTIMLTAFPLPALNSEPVRVSVVEIRRNEFSPLAQIKSLNYLDNVLAKMAAVKAGAQEAVLLNSRGHVAEASAANIFLVTSRGLATPRIADGALPGIMRQKVITLARKLNITVEERIITVEELESAAEIFLTNSLIEIQPVNRLGPITRQLKTAYRTFRVTSRKK